MYDLRLIIECVLALVLLGGILWAIDRFSFPRRHHDHPLPGTPRSPRTGR
jgi:hypothetical protein